MLTLPDLARSAPNFTTRPTLRRLLQPRAGGIGELQEASGIVAASHITWLSRIEAERTFLSASIGSVESRVR